MPMAAPYIAAAIGVGVVGEIIITVALTVLTKALLKKSSHGSFATNVTVRSTIAERHLIIGTARAAGAILFYGTGDTTPNFLWFVVAYATHQCSALKDCWLDKIKIPAADINGATGAVATASFHGKLKIWDHLGTQAQVADANIEPAFAAWTANHKLRGICYRVFRLERDSEAWPTGAPQMMTSLVDGALLYDPRLDSTNGGAGTHRADNPSTWAFSHNWALGTRWFLSGGSVVNDQATRMIKFGVQETDARIDDAYTIAAANIADQSLSGANAPPSGAEARYTCDIEVSCGQLRRDILEELLMCGGPGQLVLVHGKWRIYAGAYDSPVHAFTQDDIFGELQIDDTSGDEDRFNVCSGFHIDASKDYGEATSASRTNAAYVTADGGQTIPREVQIRGVTSTYRAQRITERILRDSRQMRTVRIPFGRQGLKIAPWETFSLTHTRYGWSAREFRCIERDVQRNEDGGMICVITAKASAASVDTDLVTADYTTGTSATNSLQTEPPDPPTALAAFSQLREILFTWTLGEFWKLNGISELWEYTANTPFASATKIWEGRATSVIISKNDFTTRYYWVRVRTIGGQTSTTEPSGNGLPAVALTTTDIVSDPEFVLATDDSYWWTWTNGGTGSAPTITLTGGNYGGYARVPTHTPGSKFNYLVSRRRTFAQGARGQVYTITVRCRSAGTGTTDTYATVIRHARAYSNSTFDNTPLTSPDLTTYPVLSLGGIYISTIGTSWVEASAAVFLPAYTALGVSDGQLPAISALVGPSNGAAGSAVDFDLVKVDPGENCAPSNVVLTATTALDQIAYYFFKNLQFNHATVAGTFTLPQGIVDIVGAKIYFEQIGAALLTIAAFAGDTLRSSPNTTGNRALAGRYARATAECVAANVWVLSGNL